MASKDLAVAAKDAADEVRRLVRDVAGAELMKCALPRLARDTGIPERRLRAFANFEARQVLAEERDALRLCRLRQLEGEARRVQHELELARARWGMPDARSCG